MTLREFKKIEIFRSKKEKIICLTYLITSSILFVFSLMFFETIDHSKEGLTSDNLGRGLIATDIFLIVIIVNIILLLIFISRAFMYFAKVKNMRSFKDYPKNEQEDILKSIFCEKCKSYTKANFKDEKMLNAMRWIYCECQICGSQNKHRLT